MNQSIRSWAQWAFLLTLLGVGCRDLRPAAPEVNGVLRLAVTTSTRDSGLLAQLVPIFEQQQSVRVDVIAVGTGAALKLGETGDVDAVLVHARPAEDAFVNAGHGIRREDVMYNSFQLLGPVSDPANIAGLEPQRAFKRIATAQEPFVSRGDNSGTHQRELQLWQAAGGRPAWDGYSESGQGMGLTMTIADQLNAYVLVDEGTYLKFKHMIRLVPLIPPTPALHNAYGIIVVNPDKHPRINSDLADAFVDFLISPDTQQQIGSYQIGGEPLFFPRQLGTATDR